MNFERSHRLRDLRGTSGDGPDVPGSAPSTLEVRVGVRGLPGALRQPKALKTNRGAGRALIRSVSGNSELSGGPGPVSSVCRRRGNGRNEWVSELCWDPHTFLLVVVYWGLWKDRGVGELGGMGL